MPEHHGREIPVNIEEEMKASYLDYAMSVIAGRSRRIKACSSTGSLCDASTGEFSQQAL